MPARRRRLFFVIVVVIVSVVGGLVGGWLFVRNQVMTAENEAGTDELQPVDHQGRKTHGTIYSETVWRK
jgi:hypothetical protein